MSGKIVLRKLKMNLFCKNCLIFNSIKINHHKINFIMFTKRGFYICVFFMSRLNLILIFMIFILIEVSIAYVNNSSSLDIQSNIFVKKAMKSLIPKDHGFTDEELVTLTIDLETLSSINTSFSSLLFVKIFDQQLNLNGNWLAHWFFSRVKKIKSSSGKPCIYVAEKDYLACAPYGTDTVLLTPSHFENSRFRRILTLLHEARHFDGFVHLAGFNSAVDGTVMGCRGVQLAFLTTMVGYCEQCKESDRIDFLKYENELTQSFRNLNRDESILLQGELFLLEGFKQKLLNVK